MKNKPEKPLWGYGIAAVYTVFALSTLGIVAFTMTQKVELVAQDYYAQELTYEQQINRVRATSELEQQVTCSLSADGQSLRVQFPPRMMAVHGTIILYRPSESELDLEYEIDPDEEGWQEIPTAKLAKGLWRVKIKWAAQGREYYNEFTIQV